MKTSTSLINLTADGMLPSLSVIQELFSNAKRNKLYGSKFSGLSLDSWADYFKLPLTYKEEMQEAGPEGLLAVPRSEAWHYHESFGTTGNPVSTWFTADDYEREVNQTWRWTSAIKPGTLVLQRFPYSFAVPPFILELKCKREGGVIVPAGYLSWNVSYPRVIDLIKRAKIEVIGCLPNEMIILEMIAEKCGYNIKKDFSSLKHVLMSGGIVSPALKEYIENRWDASVRSVYGSTETGGIASTCSEGSLHIHDNAFIVEILDMDTMKPVKAGDTGVLVVTSHYRKAAPLFRYVTKDVCKMVIEPCSCGDKTPVIQVLGRMDSAIDFNNKKIYPYVLDQTILEFGKQFDSAVYFVIVTDNKLVIRIETHNSKKKPSDESMEKLRSAFEVPLKVHVCIKGEVLDTQFLMRSPEVYKPVIVSDWRKNSQRSITITDAIIKWPKVGFIEFLDIMRRFIKNLILKKVIK
jgi:phenylacetate-CoA ligase